MKKSKILCMFFLMLNLCCIFIFPTFASAEELDNANHQYSNYIDWEQTRKIVNTKDVISIDGEILVCVEYSPTGYAIYDSKGELLERSKEAPSPYKDAKEDLVYGGPTQYLEIISPVKMNNLHSNKTIRISKETSDKINFTAKKIAKANESNKIKASNITPYIDGDIIGHGSVGGVLSSVNTSNANTAGTCGGVAAALVLHYYDIKYPNKNINSNDDFRSLLAKLENTGDLSNSTADTIKPIVKKYLQNNGGDCFHHKSLLGAFTTNKTMKTSIDAGNPIMLFAAVEDPSTAGAQSIMHAIVAHTYHERLGFMGARKYSYVCHFGWGPKYNNVEVHNAIKYITVGTSYMLEMK